MNELTANVVWIALLLAGALVEAYGIFNKTNGDTLSERTREWFRIEDAEGTPGTEHTKAGRITFAVGFLGFTAWFVPHILWGARAWF